MRRETDMLEIVRVLPAVVSAAPTVRYSCNPAGMHHGQDDRAGTIADAPVCPDLLELTDAELADLLEHPTLSDVLALVTTDPGDVLPDRAPRRERRAERYGHRRPLPPDHPAVVLNAQGADSAAWRTAERLTPAGATPEPTSCRAMLPPAPADDSPETLRLAAAHQAAQRLRGHAARRREDAEALAALLLALELLALELLAAEPLEDHAHGPAHSGPVPPEPPPEQLALTRSTLTAAPPAAAMPVPSTRCVVTLAA